MKNELHNVSSFEHKLQVFFYFFKGDFSVDHVDTTRMYEIPIAGVVVINFHSKNLRSKSVCKSFSFELFRERNLRVCKDA